MNIMPSNSSGFIETSQFINQNDNFDDDTVENFQTIAKWLNDVLKKTFNKNSIEEKNAFELMAQKVFNSHVTGRTFFSIFIAICREDYREAIVLLSKTFVHIPELDISYLIKDEQKVESIQIIAKNSLFFLLSKNIENQDLFLVKQCLIVMSKIYKTSEDEDLFGESMVKEDGDLLFIFKELEQILLHSHEMETTLVALTLFANYYNKPQIHKIDSYEKIHFFYRKFQEFIGENIDEKIDIDCIEKYQNQLFATNNDLNEPLLNLKWMFSDCCLSFSENLYNKIVDEHDTIIKCPLDKWCLLYYYLLKSWDYNLHIYNNLKMVNKLDSFYQRIGNIDLFSHILAYFSNFNDNPDRVNGIILFSKKLLNFFSKNHPVNSLFHNQVLICYSFCLLSDKFISILANSQTDRYNKEKYFNLYNSLTFLLKHCVKIKEFIFKEISSVEDKNDLFVYRLFTAVLSKTFFISIEVAAFTDNYLNDLDMKNNFNNCFKEFLFVFNLQDRFFLMLNNKMLCDKDKINNKIQIHQKSSSENELKNGINGLSIDKSTFVNIPVAVKVHKTIMKILEEFNYKNFKLEVKSNFTLDIVESKTEIDEISKLLKKFNSRYSFKIKKKDRSFKTANLILECKNINVINSFLNDNQFIRDFEQLKLEILAMRIINKSPKNTFEQIMWSIFIDIEKDIIG